MLSLPRDRTFLYILSTNTVILWDNWLFLFTQYIVNIFPMNVVG